MCFFYFTVLQQAAFTTHKLLIWARKKWSLTRKMTNSPNPSPVTSIYTVSPSIVTPSAPQTRGNWQDTVFSDNATSLIRARFHRALWFLVVMEEFSLKKKHPKKSAFQDSKDYKLTTEIMERQFLSVDT